MFENRKNIRAQRREIVSMIRKKILAAVLTMTLLNGQGDSVTVSGSSIVIQDAG